MHLFNNEGSASTITKAPVVTDTTCELGCLSLRRKLWIKEAMLDG